MIMMVINRLTILILTFLILGSVVFFYTFTKKNSHDVATLFSVAKKYAEKKNFKDSIATYERILNLQPQNTDAQNALARTLSWDQQFEKSIELFNHILKNNPKDSDALLGLAHVYSWQGNKTQAAKALRDLLLIDPTHKEAQDLLNTLEK